jgi:tetratricopeptide (TPR) repeat protein
MFSKMKAEMVNQKGVDYQKKGQMQKAVKYFKQASALAPKWATPLYNLGLLFKNARRWQQALDYNRQATKLDPKNKEAWWNLGIAATALERWDMARSAWRGYGIELPDGAGPVDLPCGFCPIRINPDGDAEIVWAQRVDPARAELASIPFPESKHRWKDIVLNDGAPVGYREVNGKDIPVFNELQLLQASAFGTYVARVRMSASDDQETKLTEIAAELDGHAEDWSTSVRLLCKACSEGRLHEKHDTEAASPEGAHLVGIAARDRDHAAKILSRWQTELSGVEVESLEEALSRGAIARLQTD